MGLMVHMVERPILIHKAVESVRTMPSTHLLPRLKYGCLLQHIERRIMTSAQKHKTPFGVAVIHKPILARYDEEEDATGQKNQQNKSEGYNLDKPAALTIQRSIF